MGSIKKSKETIDRTKSIFNYIFTSILIVIPTIFGFMKMPTEMGISIPAIVAALFFVNLDKFKRFKGAGIQAEMRDAINETYAALEQLKELGITLTEPIVDTLAVSGRMTQYIHLKYKLEIVEKMGKALRKLGANEAEIEKACETIYKQVTSDHVKIILNFLKMENGDKGDVFLGYEDWDFDEWNKAQIDRFVKDNSLVINDEAKERIKDLDYFLANKKLRREDKWQM